jgi:ribosomal protein S18 acetylase RimI-like enzyme
MLGSASVTHDTIADVEPLDNLGWHALTGPQRDFALMADGLAARYQPDVAPFTALSDDVGLDAWDALLTLLGPGGGAVLFRSELLTPPAGWTELTRMATHQMVGPTDVVSDDAFETLSASHANEMLELVARTRPGPFMARTHELGTYLGERDDAGTLVAMAGERMRGGGYTEVSAVCTDAEHRGRGLAHRLVRAVAAGIVARGETPMLHVLDDNTAARRVYESLGFKTRVVLDVQVLQAPA